jgi:hypothetical protein
MATIYKRGKAVAVRFPNLKEETRRRTDDLVAHMRDRAKKVTSSCNAEVCMLLSRCKSMCGLLVVKACVVLVLRNICVNMCVIVPRRLRAATMLRYVCF